MHEEWTDKLSDYLDDELPADERAAVAAHLASCAHCARVAADLEKVVLRAKTVTPRPPQEDLWPGVDARIRTSLFPGAPAPRSSQPRRISFTPAQLAAAAALLVAVSGGAAWKLAQRSPAPAIAQTQPAVSTAASSEREASSSAEALSAKAEADRNDRTPLPTVVPASMSFADAQYDAAVSDLEKALKTGRSHLDKSTIAIVEHNLEIIDQAIAQARQALESDPGNSYLSGHLVEARRRKLDLLRRAAALTNETD